MFWLFRLPVRGRTGEAADGPRAQTVPVTKRTVSLAFAAALVVVTMSGCSGGSADQPAQATRRIADVGVTEAPTTAPPPVTAAPTTPSAGHATTRTVTETQAIAFTTRTIDDPTLAEGKKVTKTVGTAGVRTLTYRVTLVDGKQTAKTLVSSVITRRPVGKLIAVGSKPGAPESGDGRCDPNYSGACVPIASDVDCAGGSGNGPAYVKGPVKVVGNDIYDLDRDGDGVACD
jgi:hypothetical protein